MLVLACDGSTPWVSVALMRDGVLLSLQKKRLQNTHSEQIIPMINHILSEHGYQLHDLSLLAFTKGPGWFSSVRVSACLVASMAFAIKCPILPISTFACLAEAERLANGHNDLYAVVPLAGKKISVVRASYAGEVWCWQDISVVNSEAFTPEEGVPIAILGDDSSYGRTDLAYALASMVGSYTDCIQEAHALIAFDYSA